MNKIAIVILNYNGKNLLQTFLPSVLEFSGDATIIVADNNSKDGSVEMLSVEFPSVGIIRIHENLGFCGGYNFALQQVESKYYVLLNSDVEVTKGWLDPLLNILESNSNIAAVQPRILSYDEKDSFEYAGAGGGFIDALGYPFCRGRIFDHVEKDLGQYGDTRQVFWATGACLAIRSDAFHTMGGFDIDFFAHMEEIDLCWKLNRAGHQVYYVGKSIVYHVGGGTLSRLDARKTYFNFRNGLFLILKNMSGFTLLWTLPLRIMLDWLAALSFAIDGSAKNAGAVFKAHRHFIAGFSKTLKKRHKLNSLGYKTNHGLIYPGLLIIAYFVRRIKTFGNLGL